MPCAAHGVPHADPVFAVQQIAPLPDDVPAMCGHEPHHVGVRYDSHFHRRRIIEQVALCPADQAGRRQMPDDAPGRTPRLGWQPHDGDAARPQHAQELGQIVIDGGARQVLQHQGAVDQVEVAVGKLARSGASLRTNRMFPALRLSRGRSPAWSGAMSTPTTSSACGASACDSRPTPQPKSSTRSQRVGRPSWRSWPDVSSTSVRPVARNSSTSHRPPRLPGSTSTAQSGSSAPSLVQSRRTSFRLHAETLGPPAVRWGPAVSGIAWMFGREDEPNGSPRPATLHPLPNCNPSMPCHSPLFAGIGLCRHLSPAEFLSTPTIPRFVTSACFWVALVLPPDGQGVVSRAAAGARSGSIVTRR